MSQQSAIYVDHMGTDKSVVNAARLSFGVGSVKAADEPLNNKDINLINFLAFGLRTEEREKVIEYIARGTDSESYDGIGDAMELYNQIRHQATHWTPFAHTSISVSMKAPIPIRTQCFKHKQGFVENEESRRYITCTPEIYVPEFRDRPVGSIKQGSGEIHVANEHWQYKYRNQVREALKVYEEMLADDIAPEQARFVLPQGAMVNWLWTGNLFAFANFYNKRSDPHAQSENQELAELVRAIIEPLYPVSWKALTR